MARRKYFSTLRSANKEAKRTGKSVYKIKTGVYFVGSYKQAIKSISKY